ncbi:MAG: hypothetical protein ACRBBK_04035 [Paracoccaceae bacterium]
MRQKLFIHIGLPKTGTTSFQVFCARHRDWLAQNGVCYPATMRDPAPTSSQHRFLHSDMRAELAASAPYRTHAMNVISQEVERSGLPAALISEEQFSYESWLAAPYLAQFRARFDVRILVQLRRQDRWVESMFAQAVRGGYPLDFKQFLGAQATQERLHWEHFLGIWADAFGRENIIACLYQEGATANTELLLSRLGLPPFPGPHPEVFNLSLSGEAITFLRSIKALADGAYPRLNARFGAALARITKGAPFSGFTDQTRAAFLDRYAASNEIARTRYLDGTPLIIAPQQRPDPSPPISNSRRAEILTELLNAEKIPLPQGSSIDALEAAFANACAQEEAFA